MRNVSHKSLDTDLICNRNTIYIAGIFCSLKGNIAPVTLWSNPSLLKKMCCLRVHVYGHHEEYLSHYHLIIVEHRVCVGEWDRYLLLSNTNGLLKPRKDCSLPLASSFPSFFCLIRSLFLFLSWSPSLPLPLVCVSVRYTPTLSPFPSHLPSASIT